MATAATSLLGLALPVTGELSGTWGDTVNVSITALLDTAVAGTTTLSSDADVTLTTTTLAANQARQAIILWTAGGTVTRTITVPAQSKSYIVINKTSSSQSIKIVGVGPTTGVTIVAGTAAFVVWNGVDFVTASVTSTTGILPVANGGTGLTAGTSGGVLAYTATGTLASSAALAASALVIGGGAGAAPSTTTTGTGVVTALGVNVGTAGAFVVNGGALGSPSSVGTMPAFTLGGTVAGGGNQINNVVIGASSPAAGTFTTEIINSNTASLPAPQAGTLLQIGNVDGVATRLTLDSFATNAAIHGRRANGTAAAPTALASANAIYSLGAQGYGATGYSTNRAVIAFLATQAWTDTAQGTQIAFQTTPNGSTSVANALILDQDQSATFSGAVSIGGNTAVTGTLSASTSITAGVNGSPAPYFWVYQSNVNSRSWRALNDVTAYGDWKLQVSTTQTGVTYQDVLTASSTGVAVTGTLSATGTISQTTATTGNQLSFTGNNGNDLFLVSNSTTTTRRYSIQTGSGNTQLWLGVNGDAIKIRETGVDVVLPLAVTGTLSATGTLSGGTSGTAYSFSGSAPATSLTLDSSGNLGIGETSMGTIRLVVRKDNATAYSTSNMGDQTHTFLTNNTNGGYSNLILGCASATSGSAVYAGIAVVSEQASDTNGALAFGTRPSGGGNITERARIDSSGNLGVGSTTQNGRLTVKNPSVSGNQVIYAIQAGTSTTQLASWDLNQTTDVSTFGTDYGAPLAFKTNTTERARITSGGYFKASNAGTYNNSSGAYHELRQTTDETIAIFTNTSATLTGTVRGVRIGFTAASPNDTANYLLYCDDSTSLRAGFRSNGGLANFSANNSNLSDQRVKTDIQDAGGYLAKICAIPVRTFKYKDQTDELLNLGVIAQEVEAIAPELVDTTGFGETPQDGIPLKAIYQTDLQYALMKCIQEQQALITQLTARITALETA